MIYFELTDLTIFKYICRNCLLMKRGLIFGCFFAFLICSDSFSQKQIIPKGKVVVYQDSSIAWLMRRNAMLNESKQTMPGYRLQIYYGTDRNKGTETRSAFIKEFNTIQAYLVYHQPNFKVRVGDFKTRLEALKSLQSIAISYPDAFIVKDEIPLPKIN